MKFSFAVTFFLFFAMASSTFAGNFHLSSDIYQSVAYSSIYKSQGVLVLNVNYNPVFQLIKQIEQEEGIVLKDRKEAHITVLTPPEYKLLSKYISIDEIHERFKSEIQKISFRVICLGNLSGPNNKVYYLVVDAPVLTSVREQIRDMALVKGKINRIDFEPKAYYPHITVGFVERDIHDRPKNIQTCDQIDNVVVK